jgi:PAS domain S-box-containing protein
MTLEIETERLRALYDCEVLDTPPEEAFERITRLAADLFDAPIATVSLVDADRQWFKSRIGLEACETPRGQAFCNHTIREAAQGVMVVEDATLDPRFSDSELVTAQGLRFYAGATLTTSDGHNIGALCVKDHRPRPTPSPARLEHLKTLARMAMGEMEAARLARESRRKDALLDLVESIGGIGHWRLDLRTGGLSWSDEVYRIRGVDPQSFTLDYETAVNFYTPEGRQQVAQAIEHVTATGEDMELRLQMQHVSGQMRDTVLRSRCQRDEKGEIVALFGIVQDITDQLEGLKEAEQSRRRYQLLADHVKDVITQTNGKGETFYLSPSLYALSGYRPDELIGRSMLDHVHPDDMASFAEAYGAVARGSRPGGQPVRYRVRHKQGGWVWVEANPTPVRDGAGRTEFIDILRDVTEQVALESELMAARDAANAAAQAKSDFLANMSHELRTPLTAVIGFAGLLGARPEVAPDVAPQAHRFVDKIRSASQALLATINDVLDFSKLEAGQVEIHRQPVETGRLIETVAGVLEQQARSKGLALETRLAAGLPNQIVVDPDRIRQVLMNLVGNAVKFTDAGSISILADYDAAAAEFCVRVVDTGAGMTAEQQQQLFKRFSQVDGSSTRRHGGTGLGLAICKGLVEAMGGRIGVESTPGVGTTFWFVTPAERVEVATAA